MIRSFFNHLYFYSLNNQDYSNSPSSSSSLARQTPTSQFPIIPRKTPTSSTLFPINKTPTSSTHISFKNAHGWFPSRSFLVEDSNLLFFGKQSSLSSLSKQSSLRVLKFTDRGLRGIESEGQRKEPLIVKKSLSIKTPILLDSSGPSNPTYANPNMTHAKLNVILYSLAIPLALKYNFTLGNYSMDEFYCMIADSYARGLFSSDVLPVERFYDCLENVDVTTSIADSSNEDVEKRKHGIILLVGSILLISLLCISAGMEMDMEG